VLSDGSKNGKFRGREAQPSQKTCDGDWLPHGDRSIDRSMTFCSFGIGDGVLRRVGFSVLGPCRRNAMAHSQWCYKLVWVDLFGWIRAIVGTFHQPFALFVSPRARTVAKTWLRAFVELIYVYFTILLHSFIYRIAFTSAADAASDHGGGRSLCRQGISTAPGLAYLRW